MIMVNTLKSEVTMRAAMEKVERMLLERFPQITNRYRLTPDGKEMCYNDQQKLWTHWQGHYNIFDNNHDRIDVDDPIEYLRMQIYLKQYDGRYTHENNTACAKEIMEVGMEINKALCDFCGFGIKELEFREEKTAGWHSAEKYCNERDLLWKRKYVRYGKAYKDKWQFQIYCYDSKLEKVGEAYNTKYCKAESQICVMIDRYIESEEERIEQRSW